MIISARWIFPVTSTPLHNHALVVDEGSIREIRPLIESDPDPGETCLLPGLVNAHTHLAYTALRNNFDALSFFPWIRKITEEKQRLTREDVKRSTQLGISECLRHGITTVADMSDLEDSLEALFASPLRGVFYWEVFGVEKDAADQTWADLDDRYERLKDRYSSDRLRIGISPHAPYTVRPSLYRRIAEWSVRRKVPLSFHVSESKAEEDFIREGKGIIADFLRTRAADWTILGRTSIQHLYKTGIFETKPLIAHAVQASNQDLNILRDSGIAVAHCPKSNAKFGHGIAPVQTMLQQGIRVAIGTDSAASNNRLDLLEETRFALLQQRLRYQEQILDAQNMLEMMTIDGARALQMEHQIGSLEVGKLADLALIQLPSGYSTSDQVLNHLIYTASGSDVLKTFISGKEAHLEASEFSPAHRRIL
jgi:cytosine/adenosine deaminase-related metal-dependent hydrolase